MACFVFPMVLGLITLAVRKSIPARWHIDWLNAMIWGAVSMLIVDHVASGEIIPYPPFFTASIASMLPEMIGLGGAMTSAAVVAWFAVVTFANRGVPAAGGSARISTDKVRA